MFILLVLLVLLRARSQYRRLGVDPHAARPRRARPSCSSIRSRASCATAASRCCWPIGLLLPQFESLPSRLIDYSTVLVFLIVAVSATVLTGWAGQLSLGQFAFVAVGAYLTAYYGAGRCGIPPVGRLASVAWRGAWGSRSSSAFPRLRVRGLYLGDHHARLLDRRQRLPDPQASTSNNSFTGFGATPRTRQRSDRGTSSTDKQGYYYFCFGAALARDPRRHALPPHRHRPVAARGARQRDQRRRVHGVADAGEADRVRALGRRRRARGRPVRRGPHHAAFPTTSPPTSRCAVLAVSVVGGLSSVTGAVLGTIVIIGIPTVFEGSPAAPALRQRRRHAHPVALLPGRADLDRRTPAATCCSTFIARRTNWKPSRPHQHRRRSPHLSTRAQASDAAGDGAAPIAAGHQRHAGALRRAVRGRRRRRSRCARARSSASSARTARARRRS